jgi:putative flippase GtrA
MLKKLWEIKLARFLCVGVFNTLLDLSILNTLVFLGHIPYLAANLVSASISMSISYFLNHRFVFRSKEEHNFKRFIHFFAVTGIGILGIQSLVIYSVTHLLDHHKSTVVSLIHTLHLGSLSARAFELNLGKMLAVLTAMVWNFIIYQLVIFRNPTEGLDEDVLL